MFKRTYISLVTNRESHQYIKPLISILLMNLSYMHFPAATLMSQRQGYREGLDDERTTEEGLRLSLMQGGVADLGKKLDNAVLSFSMGQVNLAVTGQSGAGKSTIINTLRSLLPKDSGAARVGTSETTMYPTPYPFPANKKVILWDLPGVNTPKFPMKDYVSSIGLTRFDALMICCSVRFSELDLWLLQQARMMKMHFYMIRTKIDNSLEDDQSDYGTDEKTIIEGIRDNMSTHLEKAGLPTDQLYLVCGKLSSGGQLKWDFPKLNEELINNAPSKNTRRLAQALVSCFESIIEKKTRQLAARIEHVAEKAANQVEEGKHGMVLSKEINTYFTWYGLSTDVLNVYEVTIQNLNQRLQEMHTNLTEVTKKMPERNIFQLIKNIFGKRKKSRRLKEEDRTTDAADVKGAAAEIKRATVKEDGIIILSAALNQCEILTRGVLQARKEMARIQ